MTRSAKPFVSDFVRRCANSPRKGRFSAALARQSGPWEMRQEAAMKLGKALFARLGLFSRKEEAPDVFALRLQRIGVRERQCSVRAGVFRTLSSRLAT